METKLILLPTAKRHVINIKNLKASRNVYKKSNAMTSRELITTPVKTMAIFCNEYIPEHFPNKDECVKYVLTVNGIDHNIVPINSHRNGNKVVRTTEYSLQSDNVIYINETIKSAKLKVIINSPSNTETPYISNLKILVGGN